MDKIFTVSDPLSRSITLKSDTYNKKIANIDGSNNNNEHGNSHPEVTIEDIRNCVEYPHFITRDYSIEKNGDEEIRVISETREEYYRFELRESKSAIFKTIVEFDDNNNGDIVTSFMNNKASSIKTEGGIIYDATKQKI